MGFYLVIMNIHYKIIFFLFCSLSSSLFAFTQSEGELSNLKYWLKLGHYRTATLSNWKSEVDDNAFFLAENGKINPKAELLATIDAFNGKNLNEKETKQIICRFPARFIWLKSKVENNWGDLDCPELQQWQSDINPETITLVFPTAFMNNPSSMFGHTLLRIDAKGQTRHKELIAFAVNFAAEAETSDNAIKYALKGLTGSYPGYFTVMPYYKKVREYNDLESRDIWEYKLNFSAKEVKRVLLHLWELQSIRLDYYFVDENCSYQLLSLLQLARDEIDLTSTFKLNVIPSDTVALLKSERLLQEPKYRASFGTKLFNYSEQLSDTDLGIVRDLMIGGEIKEIDHSPSESAAVLEMAYEWLNFKFYNEDLKRENTAPKLTKLLIARSKIKLSSPFLSPEKPTFSPDDGHASSRLGLSATNFKNSPDTVNLSYRLAYHDLLDQSAGFISGAKISLLDGEVSINEKNNLRLEQLYFVDVMSLPTDNRIFDSWSWNLRMGFDRQADISKQSGHWFTKGGYGKSIGDSNNLQAYMLGSFELNGGDITNNNLKLGVGSEFGFIWQVMDQNKVGLSSKVMYLPDSDVDYHVQIDMDWNWAFNQHWALRTKLRHQKWNAENNMLKLTLYHYF